MSKGRADYLALGDYNVVCDYCGKKRKASSLKQNWEGLRVCPEHWEPRQPQDFVRGVQDNQVPAWTRPQPADVFVVGSPEHIIAQPGDYPITGDT